MASDPEWRASLTASDRFDNIQKIKVSLESAGPDAAATAQSEAFLLESRAYQDSQSRAQYDEVCRIVGVAAPILVPSHNDDLKDAQGRMGVTIGSYTNCLQMAEGVTSEVFKTQDNEQGLVKALKVIVETRNIEPHNPQREAKILALLKKPCIPLLDTFRDQEQRFVLVFPFMPLTLADLLRQGPLPIPKIQSIFRQVFTALKDVHAAGIIHRDVKPSAFLLESSDGPVYLSDFGTAWHPELSVHSEPANAKILDIGTGAYRPPECLFGNKSYGSSVDMWAAGTMLAEACRDPPKSLFESRPAHEDGNQLGLILSIFKTLGTPTKETWPESEHFKTRPYDMYQTFEGQSWDDILEGVGGNFKQLIISLVQYESGNRATAEEALNHICLKEEGSKGL